ncbi:MAG: metallophosphoesterase [Planctomycetota bacterium]|nr:metallophosphoesterase [Planctomycetota bacterium]
MTSWIVGDIHGCSEELAQLVDELALTPQDTLVALGDLFHRGPDPAGVLDILRDTNAQFILGNHELRVLDRFGLAPLRADGDDRPALRTEFSNLKDADLEGDGRRPCLVPAARREELLRFLQEHSGYYLEQGAIPSATRTQDDRSWCVVHAGLVPGRHPSQADREDLISLRRIPLKGRPYWYEVYTGPTLVIFGHTPASLPRMHRDNGRLVALGIDTGCVYGGKLTAYAPECDEFIQVPAKERYASP